MEISGRIGDVAVTRIPDITVGGPMRFFWSQDELDDTFESLFGPYYDADRDVAVQPANNWLLRDGDTTILVDTGSGDLPRPGFREIWPDWPENRSPLVDNLAAAGVAPEDVDIVLITHMHFDHVGGMTVMRDGETVVRDGKPVLTFPNARYVLGRVEYEATRSEIDEGRLGGPFAEVFLQSVQPVVDAGGAELIEGTRQITPTITAVPSPGHSPGHYRFDVESNGEHGIVSGDIFHYPVQIRRRITEHNSPDPERDEATRDVLYEVAADRDAIVMPTHVFDPGVVRIFRDGDGFDYTVGW